MKASVAPSSDSSSSRAVLSPDSAGRISRVSWRSALWVLAVALAISAMVAFVLDAQAGEEFRLFRHGHDVSGNWLQSTKGVGESIWKLSRNPDGTYNALESWLGGSAGTATFEGDLLTIRGATSDGGYIVIYSWTLNFNRTYGTGKLTFVKMPQPNYRQNEYASTVSRIPPPVWRRSWFILLINIVVVGSVYAMYRYHIDRLLELERVRTRVASDLHDDVGSNLSLIAGLSEVLQQQAGRLDQQTGERLSVITQAARRSMDSMSDIVWAVNPKRDNVADLVHRMRRFASDSFATRDIKFTFEATGSESNVQLGPEFRREVLLVFKEAVSNCVRHSACSKAEARLQIEHRKMLLTLTDDGRGFDETAIKPGQGLSNMRQRAERLGGKLIVKSQPGSGTTVTFEAPLSRKI